MKFVRRNDLSSHKRLHMALSMSCGGVRKWGLITEMARVHKVSRQFLYDNEALLLRPFAVNHEPQADDSDEVVHKLMLCLRLHCNSSTEGISKPLQH